MQESKQWKAASKTLRSEVRNPIRAILETEFKIPSQPPKKLINLSLGQAQKEQGYTIADILKQKVTDAINSDKANGYVNSTGTMQARKAVSTFLTYPKSTEVIDPNHVILTAGTSGALYNSIGALCEVGTNILLPQPGFPLCIPICQNLGVSYKFYNLLPNQEWEIDLNHLESLIDSKTTAIVVNNPSNPCGSVFSPQHMLQILKTASKHKLPLIADEVYYGMVYDKQTKFVPFADLNAKDHLNDQTIHVPQVPIIANGAISKMYSVPGWRLGWMVFYNRHNFFDETIKAAHRLSQILLHPQVPVQHALPQILGKVGSDYFDEFLGKIRKSAEFLPDAIEKHCGRFLKAVKTRGALYMMVKINLEQLNTDEISNDVEFAQKLVNEQGVLMLPGRCFNAPGYMRIVLCHGLEMFDQTVKRLKEFCQSHEKKK